MAASSLLAVQFFNTCGSQNGNCAHGQRGSERPHGLHTWVMNMVLEYASSHFKGCSWNQLRGLSIGGPSEEAQKHLHHSKPNNDERNRCAITSSAARPQIQNKQWPLNHVCKQMTSIYEFKGTDSFCQSSARL